MRWLVSGVLLVVTAMSVLTPTHAERHVLSPALLDQLSHVYTTPSAIATFLHQTFTFQPDPVLFGEEDHWQSPMEFLLRRAGDCEDYALLAKELLQRNGIPAYVFSLFGDRAYAHTVCVFRDRRGFYNVINQDTVQSYRAPSLEVLASRLNPTWTMGGIVELDGTHGRMVHAIYSPSPLFPGAP